MRETRLTIFGLFFILCPLLMQGQTHRSSFRTSERTINIEDRAEKKFVYLFNDFVPAIAYVGSDEKAFMINYRLLQDEIIVKDENGQTKALSKDLKLDSLVVGAMTFIRHNRFGFLEKVAAGEKTYYIKYQTTFSMEEIRQGAYGDAPATAAVQSVNVLAGQSQGINTMGEHILLENVSGNPVRVNLVSGPSFGYIDGADFIVVSSRRDLNRIYPDRSAEIRSFLRKEDIALDVREDLLKLVSFLDSMR